MFVYKGLVTTIVRSAILRHVTNIIYFLPALFINAKFPFYQLYQGFMVYNWGWRRDNHTMFLLLDVLDFDRYFFTKIFSRIL